MAQLNLTFPQLKLVTGVKKTVIAPVTIVSNFNKEYRLKKFTQPKYSWTFPGRTLLSSVTDDLISFLQVSGWESYSFYFVCPFDGHTYSVRLSGTVSYDIVNVNSSKVPTLTSISDITLIQVFNE